MGRTETPALSEMPPREADRPAAWRIVAPSVLTGLRLLLLPLICCLQMQGQVSACLSLYGIAALSDGVDGRLARRLGATTRFGAFFDVTADIVCLVSLVWLLGVRGVVPTWLFAAPLAAAVAFLLTSTRTGPRYDPLGKHYGGVLYVAVGGLLWAPCLPVCTVLWVLVGIVSALVFANRWRLCLTTAA